MLNRIKGFILFVFFFLVFLDVNKIEPKAARTEFVSKDSQMVYFADGSSLTVQCTAREVIITGTHVKSNARISYDTVGFNVTLKRTGGMVDYMDFLPVQMLSKSEEITDVVTTRYVLDRKSIFNIALQIYLQDHEMMEEERAARQFLREMNENSGLDFYLHNIFRVIERVGGSGTRILTSSKAYNNLGTPVGNSAKIEGILNAAKDLYGYDWSEATKEKLPEYYDIHLKLYMEPCNTNIVLADEDGNILDTLLKDCPLVQYAKMQHTMDRDMQEIETDSARYRITEESIRKSYVCYGTSEEKVQEYSLYDDTGLKIRLSTGKIEYYQLYPEDSIVYIVCEKVEDITSEEDQEIETEEKEEGFAVDWFQPKAEVKIQAWSPENPIFFPELQSGGIPVNEYLYLDCTFQKYLLMVEFAWKEGEITLQVPISRTYQLFWKEQVGEGEDGPIYEEFSAERTVSAYVPVKRQYRYIEIKNIEYFGLSEIVVQNAALPGGESRHNQENGILKDLEMPELTYWHYEGSSEHLIYPQEAIYGIHLETIVLRGEDAMPVLPGEDFAQLAKERTGQIMVRNDRFCFDGIQYLSDEYITYSAGTKQGVGDEQTVGTGKIEWDKGTIQGILGNSGKDIGNIGGETSEINIKSEKMRIPEMVLNGSYGSSGEFVYRRILSYQTVKPDVLVYQASGINNVHVHTPVYCKGIITADNNQYCQLVNPDENMVQLMPDAEGISGDFTVEISNTGFHSARKGYGERDYSRTYSEPELSYIAQNEDGELRNEVRFPFDVFMEKRSAADAMGDVFYSAGEWIVIGQNKVRFYLPEWVQEGKYEIQFRTIAVNGVGYENKAEASANVLRINYVAFDTEWVQVSGRMYGFQVYDIADYPAWRLVFRSPEGWDLKNALERITDGTRLKEFDSKAFYGYTAGIRDEYGRRTGRLAQYTLPLMEGSHPYLKTAVAKPGYVIRFRINTSGKTMQKDDSVIEITPTFYHINEDGNDRKEVDLYYVKRMPDKKEYLVKVGSAVDQRILFKQVTGSKMLGIPEQELKTTAALRRVEYEDYRLWQDVMYSYSGLQSKVCFKTFSNFSYSERILGHKQIGKIQRNGIGEESLLSLGQTYYFEYSLPAGLMAAIKDYPVEAYGKKYGIDFTEDFWLKDGYLVLNYEIIAKVDGGAYLSYSNLENQEKGYCNMWDMEGMERRKKDEKGIQFLFHPGDIMIFPIKDSIREDYLPGGIY